jgi:hypothetical protein
LPAAAVASDRIESRPASQGLEVLHRDFQGAIMNRRKVTLTLALVLALVMGAYVAWLRHTDLRGFAGRNRTAGDRDVARLLREPPSRTVLPSLRTVADAVRLFAAGQFSDRRQAMTDPDWSEIEVPVAPCVSVAAGGGGGLLRRFERSQIRTTKKPRTMPGLLAQI